MDIYALAFVVLCLILQCEASHFRGGTITWKPTGNLYEAEFSYRLGWFYGKGHGCNESLVNQYVNKSGSAWRCESGCNPPVAVSRNGYICLAASKADDWELGEFSFKYRFDDAGPFTISYVGSAWIGLDFGSGGGSWSIQTIVDFGTRSDTLQPNYSPTVAGKPAYTIKYGCTDKITIPVLDDDGDTLRCRWATGKAECDSVCNAIPKAKLNQETCSITIDASDKRGGIYAVAIMVEDFPKRAITIGGRTYTPSDAISKSPFQFLVETPTISGRDCSEKPMFVCPSPPETKHIVVHYSHFIGLKLYATSLDTKIESFLTIGPPGVSQSTVHPDPTRQDVYYVDVTWTPKISDVGSKTICLEATDEDKIASDLYCLTVTVIDIDECASNPCLNGGICFDYIEEYMCGCMDGFTGVNCEIVIDGCASVCCLNGGTCISTRGKATCVCPPDVTGEICQTDYCRSKPCQNGGMCLYNDTIGYECMCVDGWQGIHCTYRHENQTFPGNASRRTADFMHYSDCNCYFGHGKFCYNPWYGVLGAVLGFITAFIMYAIIDCCFHEQWCCAQDEIPETENEEKPVVENEDDKVPTIELPKPETKPDHIPGHRHRKCWACEVKYNKIPPPAPWMIH